MVKRAIVGKVLEGRYRLERLLGHGGQAEVYLATDERLHRLVALKRPLEQDLLPDFVKQFRREAKLLAGFEHPNVVKLYDYCQPTSDLPFLVMEHLNGHALDDLMRQTNRFLSPRKILRFIKEIASAMQKAHEAGLIHRDLKPRNVMLVNEGQPDERFVLLDLGVAKLADFVGRGKTLADLFGTATGTLGYMAPEQFEKGVTNEKTDIYSLGATLFELWTGTTPFAPPERHDGICAYMLKVIQTPAPLPSEISSKRKVPADIEKLIMDCLAKNPDDRPASMQEIYERYRAASVTPPPTVAPTSSGAAPASKRVPSRWLKWAGSVTGLVLLVLCLGALYPRPKAVESATPPREPRENGSPEGVAHGQDLRVQPGSKASVALSVRDKLWRPPSTIDGLSLNWRLVERMPGDPPPDSFYILETKVSNALYNDFAAQTKNTPEKAGTEWRQGTWGSESDPTARDRLPVMRVAALEANAFCVWLGEKFSAGDKVARGEQGRITVRLPTREEWDRAAEAGLEPEPRMKDVTGPFASKPRTGMPSAIGDGETESEGSKIWEWTDNFRAGSQRISDPDRPELHEIIDMIELRGKAFSKRTTSKFTDQKRNARSLPAEKHDGHVGFRVVVEIPRAAEIAANRPIPR